MKKKMKKKMKELKTYVDLFKMIFCTIVFVNLYEQMKDKNFYQLDKLTLVTHFIDKRSNIDHSTLYSISRPFEMLHADIADLRFLSKLAVDPKYCLLIVDLFTSKIYVYPV